MWFQMLGPLEVVEGGNQVALGGTKQRATLGFLLLRANRVVATSHLLSALWSFDDAPTSARKILQNAVWGLRRVLAADREERSVALLTKSPGYMLQVDLEQVDLYLFNRRVEEGRAKLAAGSSGEAARLLREALSLWRGPVLADLIETGTDWPELTRVENARLGAMEDYFEAELACGQHHSVLDGLEALIEAEPTRERPYGQLMLALYRCGRQADALGVYARLRSALVENLGLEPGPALQALEHAILTQDPSLSLPQAPLTVETAATMPPAVAPAAVAVSPPIETALAPAEATAGIERRHVSAVFVRAHLVVEPSCGVEPDVVDQFLQGVGATIRDEVEGVGGVVVASLGSLVVALFGASEPHDDDPERAVCTVLRIRDRLIGSAGPATGAAPGMERLAMHAVVVTGEALVHHPNGDDGAPPLVNGSLFDESRWLLDVVPAGEVWVCDATRRSTDHLIDYRRTGSEASVEWQVIAARQECTGRHAVPFIDRERELEVVCGLLERVRHRATPHMVTILGEPGMGKTRLAMELEQRMAADPDVRFVMGRVPPAGTGDAFAETLFSCCGIPPGDPRMSVHDNLSRAMERLAGCEEETRELVSCLGPFVTLGEPGNRSVDQASVLRAWQVFLERVACDRPLVLVIDDMHRAEDAFLDFVEGLAESSGSVPLLVVTTARPELLDRRPEWCGGQRHSTTITLDFLSEGAVDRLLEFLLSSMEHDLKLSAKELFSTRRQGGPGLPTVSVDLRAGGPSLVPLTKDVAHAS